MADPLGSDTKLKDTMREQFTMTTLLPTVLDPYHLAASLDPYPLAASLDPYPLAASLAVAPGAAAVYTAPSGHKDPGKGGDDDGSKTGLVTKTRPKTKKPSLYKVLLLNDDYTPMEFVVLVLQKYFGKNRDDAERIMLHVHQKGVGVCGVYTFEIAETKVTQVMDFSRSNNHPLQCTMEKE